MAKLKGEERRNRIMELLARTDEPLSGSRLAKELGVSRQVIVTDIALLRAKDPAIVATNSGYILMQSDDSRRVFKVKHTEEQTEDELNAIVDLGGTVLDVYIEHKVYGTIRAPLDISSKRDVRNFMDDLASGVSSPISRVTDGYHYHTVSARSSAILDEIETMLGEKGYLIETRDAPVIYSPKSYKEV